MTGLATTLVTGLALGAVYALVGAAVATVATATRTLHLAIGSVLVAGVLVDLVLAVEVVTGLPPVVAFLAAVVAGAAMSALALPLVLWPLPRGLAWLVGFAVLGGAIDALAARTLGTRTVAPQPLVDLGWEGSGALAGVDAAVVTALVVGAPVAALLALAVARTRWGRRLRVVGGSEEAARPGGIDPARVHLGALAVAGGLAVLAGMLVAPIVFVGVGQAASLTVRGVAAAALLGRGGPGWALPAGLLLGLSEAAAQQAWPAAGGEVAVAVVIVGVLVVRGSEAHRAWGRAW